MCNAHATNLFQPPGWDGPPSESMHPNTRTDCARLACQVVSVKNPAGHKCCLCSAQFCYCTASLASYSIACPILPLARAYTLCPICPILHRLPHAAPGHHIACPMLPLDTTSSAPC
eukprot:1139858-Pelagomonas_calceolata.AAC.14